MTSTTTSIDAARVELLLTELRLPSVKAIWPKLAAQSDKEGWPAARFLATLAEHEVADRGRRRIERHMTEARLPAGKTLATFDFESVPTLSKAQVMALAAESCGRFANSNRVWVSSLPAKLTESKPPLSIMRTMPTGLRSGETRFASPCALMAART